MSIKGWLLDTHALLWMLQGDGRLSDHAIEKIDGELPLFHSLVNFWEIGIKLSGKGFDFHIKGDWMERYPKVLSQVNIGLLTPSIEECRLLQDLPKHHGDPFDRMLVCQAIHHGLGIISADRSLDAYLVPRAW